MKFNLIAIGSFLAVSGGVYALLSITTGAAIFEPSVPPIVIASIGGILMITGLIMP